MERARGESRRLSGKGNMILMILEVIGTEILQPKYLLLLECTRGRRRGGGRGYVMNLGLVFIGQNILSFF